MTTQDSALSSPADTIHVLWERLAGYPASATEDALNDLLQTLCDQVNAQNAYWLGSVRISDRSPIDPLNGWRPRVLHYLHNDPERSKLTAKLAKEADRAPDPAVIEQARRAGKFRAALNRDLVPDDWAASEFNQQVYVQWGITDTMYVTTPVNKYCEAYIGLQRKTTPDDPFTREDLKRAATLLRGLTWFQRRVFLSFGLMISETPLSAMERKVMSLLLTEKSEKQIADELNHAPTTTHSYVREIYRKLGINSRASLAAIWLGHYV